MKTNAKLNVVHFRNPIIIKRNDPFAYDFDIVIDQPKLDEPNLVKDEPEMLLYCRSLIEKICSLQKSEIISFLRYQCSISSRPTYWLLDLDSLLETNVFIFLQLNKFGHFITAIREISMIQSGMKRVREYPMPTKLDFQITSDDEPNMVKDHSSKSIRFRWNERTNVLANIFYQCVNLLNQKGEPLIPASRKEIIEFICTHFYRSDGSDFNESSLKTYLSPNRFDKRPKSKSKIDIETIRQGIDSESFDKED